MQFCDKKKAFANKVLQVIDENKIDVGCMRFIEEAFFHLEGYMNKQNWLIWSTEYPSVCSAKALDSEK